MIIGISGHARVGKDTLALSLKKSLAELGIKAEINSFANQLKSNIDSFLIKEFRISAFTTNDDEKKIARPMLVAYGNTKRAQDEDCWIKEIAKKIDDTAINIIPDVRFLNEANWIDSQGGHIIHIDRDIGDGTLVPPANEDEKINTPLVKEKSCFNLVWQTTSNQDDIDKIVANLIALVFQEEIELWKATYPSLQK